MKTAKPKKLGQSGTFAIRPEILDSENFSGIPERDVAYARLQHALDISTDPQMTQVLTEMLENRRRKTSFPGQR